MSGLTGHGLVAKTSKKDARSTQRVAWPALVLSINSSYASMNEELANEKVYIVKRQILLEGLDQLQVLIYGCKGAKDD